MLNFSFNLIPFFNFWRISPSSSTNSCGKTIIFLLLLLLAALRGDFYCRVDLGVAVAASSPSPPARVGCSSNFVVVGERCSQCRRLVGWLVDWLIGQRNL